MTFRSLLLTATLALSSLPAWASDDGRSATVNWFNFRSVGLPLMGFGGNFDLSDREPGTGLQMYLMYDYRPIEMVPLEVPNTYTGQFFGFTSSRPFDGVYIIAGTQTGIWIPKQGGDFVYAEAYHINNLLIATPVPEPASGLMLLSGLLLLALTGRKLPRCFRIAGFIPYLIAHERRSIRTAKIFRTGAPLVGPDLGIPPAARD